MYKKIMKNFKRVISLMMIFAMAVVGIQITTENVEASSSTNKLPISCYTLNGRVTTYTNSACTGTSGYIDSVDLTKITAFYTNYDSVMVQYPTASGTKTAYAKMSSFFANISFSTSTGKTGKNLTAYRRSTGSETIGTVYASDTCIVTGTANGRTQLIYPTSSGYKLGWVNGTYNFNSSSSGSTVTTFSEGNNSQGTAICFNSTYYANCYADLKAAFGYDYNKLLSHWQSYGIKEGRSASPVFDSVYYLQVNRDVAQAYGSTNYTAAYNHFLTYGCNEGRTSSKYYSGIYYRSIYGDLSSMNYFDLASHYLNYGIKEGRWANYLGYIPGNMNQTGQGGTQSNASTGFDPIWPCANTYTITTLYRYSDGTAHSCRFKYGIDIGAPYGENILAVESGTVIRSEYSTSSGFGNWIMIQHSNGKVSLYAHMSSRKVSVGAKVSKGQVIGQVGNSSAKYNIGAHLHFELDNSNTTGAAGDAYQEYYKTKYANKIVLTQAAKKYSTP